MRIVEDEQKKTIDNILCDSIAVFVLSISCGDMFFVDFNIEYFANNIMWFALMIFLIVDKIYSAVSGINEYRYLKEG